MNIYTICTKPVKISFECEKCGATNEVVWNDVLADDEYSKWTGDIYPIKCEECGAINEFEDCDTD